MTQKSAAGKTPASKPAQVKPNKSETSVRKQSGSPTVPSAQKRQGMDDATIRNREVQLNHNNDRYWKARGHDGRPEQWELTH